MSFNPRFTAGQRLGAGVIAAAMVIAVPFIGEKEGESLESYRDVVGVWTICNGETLGVGPGMKKTREECRELLKSRTGQFMQGVANQLKVPVSPATLASHTSFAYNIGAGGYKSSTTLRLTNTGDIAGGCRAMVNWSGLTVNGVRYNCNKPENLKRINGCRGLMNRRNAEIKMCLEGV